MKLTKDLELNKNIKNGVNCMIMRLQHRIKQSGSKPSSPCPSELSMWQQEI